MRTGVNVRPWTVFLVVLLVAAGYLSLRPGLILHQSREFAVFAGALLASIVAVAVWSGRRTERQLNRVAKVAQSMTDGDYTARCSEDGDDSLSDVSASLNQLARQITQNLEQIETSQRQIREMAYRDPLTGLPNRRMFEELFEREVEAARRSDYGLALAILDLDNLKDVNDSLGHSCGDGLLAGISKRLSRELRGYDVLARLGGDEFALVMRTGGRREHIVPAVNRLLRRTRDPFDIEGRRVMTSASIGLCFFPEDGETTQELMSNADFALYQAKNEGRNKVRQFDQSMNKLANDRLEVEQDLRRAMTSDEFSLHYQPLVALSDRRLVGLEALVRWNHPQKGLIMPDSFIVLAEEAGLMPQLGYQVLMKACRRAVLWRDRGLPPVPISVNVSVRQLQASDFVDLVERVLVLTDIPPELLKLELTENLAAEGTGVLDQLSRLREWGVRLAIDDFGTGYSSFRYLLEHHIDTIKIDRSFVAGLPENPDSIAIVKAILSMARSLGLETTAEGIETTEQLRFLVENGCDQGQGYLFLQAVSVDEIEPHLRAGRIQTPTPEEVHPLPSTSPLQSRPSSD